MSRTYGRSGWFAILGATILLGALPSVEGEVVERGGTKVEFIGLEEWTPERIDAILTGGRDIEPYYCAATLKDDVGMADAAVMHDIGRDGSHSMVVMVVEPKYAERVVYRPEPTVGSVRVESWKELAVDLEQPAGGLQRAIMSYADCLTLGEDEAHRRLVQAGRGGEDEQREAWRRFAKLRTPEDFDRAVWALAHDADSRMRSVAAVVLAGFPERDLALYSLVDGLRDADARVRGTCGQLLMGWTRSCARPVDWSPALESLRHVISGTNLFALPRVLELLTATEVSPSLAADLVGGRCEVLSAMLDASHERTRERARSLLTRLAGKDLGVDRSAWEGWFATLDAGDRAEREGKSGTSRE